jgi:predicted TIM-barrel enzyme
MTTVDMIVIYNSGRFRMAGRGSLAGLLPYKDANAIVMEMAGEVPSITLLIPRSFSSTVTPVVCVCVCVPCVRACVLWYDTQVLPIVKNVPVLAGVCATDPFRNMDQFLKQV